MLIPNRPSSKKNASDPASSYERAKPEKEAGKGRLDMDPNDPPKSPDRAIEAVSNRQDPQRQINSDDDDIRHAASVDPDLSNDPRHQRMADPDRMSPPADVHDSMKNKPQKPTDPRNKRHSKTAGKGGTS